MRAEANSEVDQPPTTPRINSSVCEEEFFDRVELLYLFLQTCVTGIHLSGGVAIPPDLESTGGGISVPEVAKGSHRHILPKVGFLVIHIGNNAKINRSSLISSIVVISSISLHHDIVILEMMKSEKGSQNQPKLPLSSLISLSLSSEPGERVEQVEAQIYHHHHHNHHHHHYYYYYYSQQEERWRRGKPRGKSRSNSFSVALPSHQRQSLQVT